MKTKPLKEHALEMLRLVNSHSDSEFGGYWMPNNKDEVVCDAVGTSHVFVHGTQSTGALQTLTTRGLVAEIPDAMHKWARRITPAGRAFFLAHFADAILERERARLARTVEDMTDFDL